MGTHFQPRPIIVIVAVAMTVACGCQGGWCDFVPGGQPQADPFASAADRGIFKSESKMLAPAVTEKNYARVQLALGENLEKERKFEAAEAAYQAALRNDDSLARANHRLALVRERIGKGKDAKPLFLQAMELDPKNAEIVCDYGYWCYLRQDFDGAQTQFLRALELDPTMKRAQNNLGLIYARTNRPENALERFALAGLSPAESRTNLGLVYLTQQRAPDAKIELARAIGENPGFEKAKIALASLEKAEVRLAAIEPQAAPAYPVAPAYVAGAPATLASGPPTQPRISSAAGPAADLPAPAAIPTAPRRYPNTSAQELPSIDAGATTRLLPPPPASDRSSSRAVGTF